MFTPGETTARPAHDILRDALDTVQAERQAKNIQVVLNLNAERRVVPADPVRLQQVFWDVLKNAVKFTPKKGTVTARSSTTEDGRLVIRISDTGLSLTADEAERLFHAFVQGTHRFGGLGLGLAISRSLVEMHSGTIAAESAGRNLGSTFKIELPLAAGTETRVVPPTSQDAVKMPNGKSSASAVWLVENHMAGRVH